MAANVVLFFAMDMNQVTGSTHCNLLLAAVPARRALENDGITFLQQLSRHKEEYFLQLHGMWPGSIPKRCSALKAESWVFRKNNINRYI